MQLFHGRNGRLSMTFSPPNFLDVTTQSGVFSGATAMTPSSANLTGTGEPQLIDGANVTASFFNVLGVVPRLGRGLVDADGDGSGADVVVLSDGLWRRQFGARADIVGSTMRMDGKPFTIVGVAPPDLNVPAGADYWRPLVFKPRDVTNDARGAQWIGAIARLKPGVNLEQAKSAMAVVAERLARDFPRTNKDRVMTAMGLQDRIVRSIRPALLILLGAVTLVLLVACVNVANLLLARANGRTREVAVRAALGAGRRRLVQQFLAESVVLGLAGGAAGLVVAYWSTQALVALGPASIPRLGEVGVDWRVLAFTIAIAVLTSVVFGLVPALSTTGARVARFVSTAGRGAVGSGGTRVRKTLVVCEMALAVVLLIGAGLLIRSYQRISEVNPGFSADHLLTFTVALPEQKYKTSAEAGRFMRDLVARVGDHPGVRARRRRVRPPARRHVRRQLELHARRRDRFGRLAERRHADRHARLLQHDEDSAEERPRLRRARRRERAGGRGDQRGGGAALLARRQPDRPAAAPRRAAGRGAQRHEDHRRRRRRREGQEPGRDDRARKCTCRTRSIRWTR